MNIDNTCIIFDARDTLNDWFETINKYIKESKYKAYICYDYDKTFDSLDNLKNKVKYNIIIPLFTGNMIKNSQLNDICIYSYGEVFNIFYNKKLFGEYMTNNFYDLIPKSINVCDILVDSLQYPLVLKIGISYASYGVYVINNKNDLDHVIKTTTGDYILQEYIWSDNYRVGQYLCINGNVIHQQHYVINIDKNVITIIKGMLSNPECIEFNDERINSIFKKTNYTGFACVDYTIVNQHIKIFEINPRFGGTTIHKYDIFCAFMDKLLEHLIDTFK